MKKECISPEKLSAFLDGELSGEEKERISFHLKDCLACQKEAQELTSLSELLNHSFKPIEPSPYFSVKLKQEIADRLANRESSNWLKWVKKTLIPIGVTALILVSFVTGSRIATVLYQNLSNNQPELYTSSESVTLNESPESSFTNTYVNLLSEGEK